MADPKQPAPTLLRPWKAGDPLSAEHLDEPRRYLQEAESSASFAEQLPHGALPLRVLALRIVSVSGDYLVCERDDSPGATVNVAKPYLMRTSIASRDGKTYTYASSQQREADDGVDTETHYITESYVAGDYVFALGPITGGTGVADAPRWLDMNTDGRAWAQFTE